MRQKLELISVFASLVFAGSFLAYVSAAPEPSEHYALIAVVIASLAVSFGCLIGAWYLAQKEIEEECNMKR
jgi:hypothetical protein